MSATTGYIGRELTPEERALALRLHNEPLAGSMALGGPCRCPVCQPDLHTIEEGGEG